MASNEIKLVNTCGICETITEPSLISTHKCLEGYKRFFIDNNKYFYPVCDNGAVIRKSATDNGDCVVIDDESISYSEKDTNVEHVGLDKSCVSPLSETSGNISLNSYPDDSMNLLTHCHLNLTRITDLHQSRW